MKKQQTNGELFFAILKQEGGPELLAAFKREVLPGLWRSANGMNH